MAGRLPPRIAGRQHNGEVLVAHGRFRAISLETDRGPDLSGIVRTLALGPAGTGCSIDEFDITRANPNDVVEGGGAEIVDPIG